VPTGLTRRTITPKTIAACSHPASVNAFYSTLESLGPDKRVEKIEEQAERYYTDYDVLNHLTSDPLARPDEEQERDQR
jgi:hypothetical protein